MTVELEEFMEWQASVEARLCTLEAASDQHVVQVSGQRGLIISMDADVSKIQVEFRAQRAMLQALHDTQTEHTAALRGLRTGVEELRLGQKELRRGQAQVLAGVQAIVGLLTSVEGGGESDDS